MPRIEYAACSLHQHYDIEVFLDIIILGAFKTCTEGYYIQFLLYHNGNETVIVVSCICSRRFLYGLGSHELSPNFGR